MNCAIASSGMRTARPQFTRGSFRRNNHARIVAGFNAKASLASFTESNFVMLFTFQGNSVNSPMQRNFVGEREFSARGALRRLILLEKLFWDFFETSVEIWAARKPV